MKITSLKLQTSHLTPNEEAMLRCQTALELKEKGDYNGAQEIMRRIWRGVGQPPQTESLHDSVAAEVFLCAGILTRWIESKDRHQQSQEVARDLISKSIGFYESIGDVKKVASARVELAYCYWHEGALDEARILFNEALKKLTIEGNTRANALLGLAIVEWSASRFKESLGILADNTNLFNKITSHAIRGAYHSQVAMALRELADKDTKASYFKRAIEEYGKADYHFKLVRNTVFRADVKNNVGNLSEVIFMRDIPFNVSVRELA